MRNLFIVGGLTSLLFLFQNCGGVEFASSDAKLVAKNAGPEEAGGSDNIPNDDRKEPDRERKKHAGDCKDHNHDHEGSENRYICILDGPGASVRLGMSEADGALQENGQTPRTVCMSKKACEEIVSTAFDVKMAVKRGFCPDKNPHVVELTDEEIADLVKKE